MRCALLLASLLMWTAPSPGWAATGDAQPAKDGIPARLQEASTDKLASPDPSGPAPLSAAEMSAVHAGSDAQVVVLTTQTLSAEASGNTINAGTLTSGEVSFSPQALSGFAGVGNFVINTGANNTLQGAINISIVGPPAP